MHYTLLQRVMAAQESNVNTISNNIANVNTTGFKKARTEFDDLLYETVQEAGAKSSSTTEYNVGHQVGSGARVSATRKIHSQGSPQMTNNPYDLMVNGEGFMGVVTPNGELKYTRDGSFNVDAQGNLVTRAGHKVFPGVVVPPNTMKISISETGVVEAFMRDAVEPMNLGGYLSLLLSIQQVFVRMEEIFLEQHRLLVKLFKMWREKMALGFSCKER